MERRIAAIMAADIVGYSRMMEADETGTRIRQKRLQQDVIDPALADAGGRVVKTMGDGMLVEFASPVAAVQCALALQEALTRQTADWPSDQRQNMRIGINLGDVMVEDGDLFGDAVNIAARLEQMAAPGGITISGTVYDHLKSNVDADLMPMGETAVKNISQPVRSYQVLPRGAARRPRFKGLRRMLRPRRALAVVLAACVLLLALLGLMNLTGGRGADSDELSIAVLPFRNGSGDPSQDYFAAGVSEDINTDLSKVVGLTVLAPSAAYKFGEDNVSAAWVGNALGVDYTLDGTVRRVGDQIRLTVRLIEVSSGEQVWAERYDRRMDDVFAIQDEIAEQVVAELPATLDRGKRGYTPNVAAYDAYILSRAQRIPPTPANLVAARENAARAIEIDPQFAGGHAGLAFVKLLQAEAVAEPGARATLNAEARALAREAIRLDPDFGPAWGSLAEAHFRAGAFDAALKASRKAVALSPTDSLMRGQLGRYLSYAGSPEQGIDHVRAALRMSPDSLPLLFFLGLAQRSAGQAGEAVESLAEHRSRLNNRVLPAPTVQYIAALVEDGQMSAAQQEVARLQEFFPDYGLDQALAYHRYKDPADTATLRVSLTRAGLR